MISIEILLCESLYLIESCNNSCTILPKVMTRLGSPRGSWNCICRIERLKQPTELPTDVAENNTSGFSTNRLSLASWVFRVFVVRKKPFVFNIFPFYNMYYIPNLNSNIPKDVERQQNFVRLCRLYTLVFFAFQFLAIQHYVSLLLLIVLRRLLEHQT